MSSKEPKAESVPEESIKEKLHPTRANEHIKVKDAEKALISDVANDEQKFVDVEELIDMNTFEQLLDMDDEEDHEFSLSIVLNYFEQAEATFKDMDAAFKKQDLMELSRLGHFLKGSSAAIGLKKVKATCEKIQNIGNRQDDEGVTLESKEALERIEKLLPQVKDEYNEAEGYLKAFYNGETAPVDSR
ncbi:signal transduction histidine kinase [Fennellomyces sp. T-0311]|nr:signal transduction histidine kinase [Fennellomyces sp. T-0311]